MPREYDPQTTRPGLRKRPAIVIAIMHAKPMMRRGLISEKQHAKLEQKGKASGRSYGGKDDGKGNVVGGGPA